MKRILLLLLVLVALLAASCGRTRPLRDLSAAEKMRIADELYEEGKYHRAIPYYTDVALDRRSAYTAEAQMKLADSYFHQNKFTEARLEYQEVIRLFRDHPEIGRAYFQIGVCYYEESLGAQYTQEETYEAINAFETFLERFPFSPLREEAEQYLDELNYKLLEKKFYNGYIYFKIYDYSAALMYFDEIMDEGKINEVDKKSRYYATLIYLRREDKQNALRMIDSLNELYPESNEAQRVKRYRDRLQ